MIKTDRMKNYLIAAWLFVVGICTVTTVKAQPRQTYNFNPGWKLYVGEAEGAQKENFDDSQWKTVTLPYAWNENEAFCKDIKDLSTGVAWYRKSFVVPESSEGQNFFLEFEGVRQAGEFYMNGTLLGLHENGVMAVGFNITSLIKPYPAVNVLAVRTDNSWDYKERFYDQGYQWSDKNFNANYGGIPKNVFLHVTGKVYQTLPLYSSLGTTGVYVYASDFDIAAKKAVVHVESQVKNETSQALAVGQQIIIENIEGKEVARFNGTPLIIAPGGMVSLEASQAIKNLEFWSWGYGYLYTVRNQLVVNGKIIDEVPVRTGFRKTEFKNGMVYLNDRIIMMKGYAQRTSNEWPAAGMSVPPWLSDFSNQLMVEGNGNFVRWMHVTPWKQDVESCDRVGFIEAMPAGDSEKDVEGRRWGQRTELMRDAIVYNRNAPSIVFYEGGNESISEEHMAELKRIRDTYDPYGGRAIGSREMLDSKVAEYGGEMLYINKSAGKPLFAMEYSRDEGLRKYWDEYTPPYHKDGDGPLYKNQGAYEYNRNQDSHAIENVVRWYDYYRERPGTGTRVSSGGANIVFSDTNTHHRGAENYRRSGEVDAMRIPKDAYWANQVMWAGWVEPEKQLTHIIGHWNYRKGTKKNIYVVSGGDKVELFVNGKSKGFGKQGYRFLFTFENIDYEQGTIKAIAYNNNGEQVSENAIETAGSPYAIKLTATTSPTGFKADGADMALLQVEVTDKQGRRCPTALNLVHFNIEGEGEWLGGIAQGENNYILSKDLPVECGINRALVRSATLAGDIKITATSKGLKPATIELKTSSFESKNGLAATAPSYGLPSFLKFGPTPQGESVKVSRSSVKPVNAVAGANLQNAQLSYDDNELTEWSNNDSLSTGWIRYTLEREANIGEICMKLGGWRTRSYPIAVMVGNKEVFKGETERSLGYITIQFVPVKGKEITVKLIGVNSVNDVFNLVEVTEQKDQETVKDLEESKQGNLKIVEIDFYEKVDQK